MVKRFSRIKYLLQVGGAGVKSSEIAKKYAGFKLGKNMAAQYSLPYTYETKKVARGTGFSGALRAFGYPATADAILVRYSGRCGPSLGQTSTGTASGIVSVQGVSASALNVGFGSKAEGSKIAGFTPAKMVVFVLGQAQTGATKSPKSKITGLEYNKRLGSSYTFSFGADKVKPGRDTELGMRGYLTGQVAKGNQTISFKDEKP